jgi:NAD(P)-dependent dehydrogenase (short-subunit alcohol dehydrogenase family)
MGKLSGKMALITGASRGIGRAVAKGFGEEGAALFLVGHRDSEALQETIGELRHAGVQANGGLFDIGVHAEVQRLGDAVAATYGRLDIIVNNAGVLKSCALLDIPAEQWERTIRTHLFGTIHCTTMAATRFFKAQRRGKVINLSAPAATRAVYGVADYAVSKGGIDAFTRNAAKEFLNLNIQVNAIVPVGHSRMVDDMIRYRGGGSKSSNLPTAAPPENLIQSVLFLASGDSDYVTGQIITADGGFLLTFSDSLPVAN